MVRPPLQDQEADPGAALAPLSTEVPADGVVSSVM